MPTIEIVSFNSTELGLNQAEFDVAIIEENRLKSHRGLFYDLLRKQNGVIIHIGNPDFRDDKEGCFFAGQIIDWEFEPSEIFIPEYCENEPTNNHGANQQFQFKFLEEYKADIDKLLNIALDKSPIKRICFLTNYQFGPENGSIEIIYTINDFWKLHDTKGLTLNKMYEIYGK